MKNLIQYFTQTYIEDDLYIRKKSEYSVTFITLIMLVMITILLTELIVLGLSILKVIQTFLFVLLFISILLLVKYKRLELAINLLIISGFARCIMMYFYVEVFQFYATAFLIILTTGVVHLRKYQIYTVYIAFLISFVTKIYIYSLQVGKGIVNPFYVLQSFYITCILAVFIVMVNFLVKIIHREILEAKELERLANTDVLTGLYNRRKFNESLIKSFDYAEKQKKTFSVILLDIDYFKQINDELGHKVGDQILTDLSQCLNNNLKEKDMLFRWGGEEFFILANGSSLGETVELAERLRTLIETSNFNIDRPVTISLGVAEYDEIETPESLIIRVDNALYKAKNNGRNRTEYLGKNRPPLNEKEPSPL